MEGEKVSSPEVQEYRVRSGSQIGGRGKRGMRTPVLTVTACSYVSFNSHLPGNFNRKSYFLDKLCHHFKKLVCLNSLLILSENGANNV